MLFVHIALSLLVTGNAFKLSGFHLASRSQEFRGKTTCAAVDSIDERDKTWLTESNQIEYVDGLSFESLVKDIGLNISSELIRRNIIPKHLTSSTDLFCSRELNMQQIQAIGFDMDWTLAQYNRDFDLLAYNGAVSQLVHNFGFSDQCLELEYELTISRRGCIIDTERGNFIKLDNHRYVRQAEHGLTALSREELKALFKSKTKWETETYSGPNFVNIDTPFSLVDACLYAQLVDLRDKLASSDDPTHRDCAMTKKSYKTIWSELRQAVDRCHKDGCIKLAVAQNPSKYIEYDPNIFPMLDSFRKSGRKVFLLTNSDFPYTQVVMNYLYARKEGDELNLEWTDYFDLVVVQGNKPAFLIDEGSLSFYQVVPNTLPGKGAESVIRNIENFPSLGPEVRPFLDQYGKYFQGGNAKNLQYLLQIPTGDRILYVGDHVYSDVLRAKRTLGWRTCLIVPELTKEIITYNKMKTAREELFELRRTQHLLEDELDALYSAMFIDDIQEQALSSEFSLASFNSVAPLDNVEYNAIVLKMKALKAEISEKQDAYDKEFHPKWGQLFKAGFRESRISSQIKDFACLFTSRASNLGLTSPQRPFRPSMDYMPHDLSIDRKCGLG